MKNPSLVLLMMTYGLLTPMTLAQSDYEPQTYVEVHRGFSHPESIEVGQLDIGFETLNDLWSVSIGREHEQFRYELGVYWSSVDVDDINFPSKQGEVDSFGKYEALSLMINGFWYFNDRTEPVRYFVGAGLGASYLNVEFFQDANDWVLAWQTMTGIDIELTENVVLVFDYTLSGTTDPSFNGQNLDAPLTHGASVGLRVRF